MGDRTFYGGAGGDSGGLGVLEDSGNVWEASTAVALGYRIAENMWGAVRVFECSFAGTTGGTNFGLDPLLSLAPLGITFDGTARWRYLGIVGQVSWQFAPGPQSSEGPVAFTNPEAPDQSANLLSLAAGPPSAEQSVFEIATDGDSDWTFEDGSGPGMRWNNRGNAFITEITAEYVRVIGNAGNFRVDFNPFAISMEGLPTVNPNVAGRLWVESGTLKVSAG